MSWQEKLMALPTSNPIMAFDPLKPRIFYFYFSFNHPCQSLQLTARQINLLPSSLPTPTSHQGHTHDNGVWEKGVQRTEGLKLPVGMVGKGIQMVRTPGVLGLGFPHLSGPVKASQLPTSPAPLFAALNFLPHQRKWGETAGAATATRAMVSPYAQESRPPAPSPRPQGQPGPGQPTVG